MARLAALASLAALPLAAGASPAGAAVTIGQLAPGVPPTGCAISSNDFIQPAVTSANTYVVPGNGRITAWTTNAAAGGGQTLKMKIVRPVAGTIYRVVGSDGPRALTPSGTTGNTFPTSIPVRPGDVLGVNSANAGAVSNACLFSAPGDAARGRFGDLADGASADYDITVNDFRVNATAVFDPTNTFSFGKLRRNLRRGIATIAVRVPNAGRLVLRGKGLNRVVRNPGAARVVKMPIRARGGKLRQLNRTGKTKVRAIVTYRPRGGDPRTKSRAVPLVKRRRG